VSGDREQTAEGGSQNSGVRKLESKMRCDEAIMARAPRTSVRREKVRKKRVSIFDDEATIY